MNENQPLSKAEIECLFKELPIFDKISKVIKHFTNRHLTKLQDGTDLHNVTITEDTILPDFSTPIFILQLKRKQYIFYLTKDENSLKFSDCLKIPTPCPIPPGHIRFCSTHNCSFYNTYLLECDFC